MQLLSLSKLKLDAYKQKNDWVQVVVYVILAYVVLTSSLLSYYCIRKGGTLDWSYRFGVFVKIACKFNR